MRGGGNLILIGIILVVFGFLLISPVTDIIGWISVIAGAIIAVIGVINFFTGSSRRA